MKYAKAVFKFLGKILKVLFVKKSCCEYSDSCRPKDEDEKPK